jgi:hypothetical protein
VPRIHGLESGDDGAVVCVGDEIRWVVQTDSSSPPLTTVENHADKDGTEEKVELKVPLVLLPWQAVPGIGAGRLGAV